MTAIPFLKWAGGKRWLTTRGMLKVPQSTIRYVEPFLGSGALFFSQNSSLSLLSDINSDLINCYNAIREDPTAVESALARHGALHSRDHYYKVRADLTNDPVEDAARFIYLNRTCWNGLYRVNRKGLFNVPIGTKSSVILDTDDFKSISLRLRNSEILCCDFEETIVRTGRGDFVFVDPPYTVAHNHNGFVKYNENIFSWDDQVRLSKACLDAHGRGATVLVTNADHPSVRSLYETVAKVETVSRPSIISGNSAGRKMTSELIITFTAE